MKLEVNLFNEEPQSHLLESAQIYVGRSSQCDVVINHESMSRKHCLIELEDGKIFVTDLGSTNGVSIDGTRISANQKTFYLNSLPLMIGAASITIDLTDHQTKAHQNTISQPEVKRPASTTGSFNKTATTQKISKESTRSLELETKMGKKVVPKKGKGAVKDQGKKVKELIVAITSVLVFAAMALWHFSQE